VRASYSQNATSSLTSFSGNSGIGKEFAGLLLEDPKRHVIITSRSVEKGEAAVKELKARGLPGTIEVLPLQVTEPESITSLAKTVESKYGR
jgi:NAD(P)-dependent dehydrogenase (short-subunit alcohol dehydrogenase family)